mmetsp:Transcript_1812/g.4630  ORF Transcript_1812/g.4630 Transcript_1812/m.4630 type:complete len:316 (-) Transcript_1812:432-1379(-)
MGQCSDRSRTPSSSLGSEWLNLAQTRAMRWLLIDAETLTSLGHDYLARISIWSAFGRSRRRVGSVVEPGSSLAVGQAQQIASHGDALAPRPRATQRPLEVLVDLPHKVALCDDMKAAAERAATGDNARDIPAAKAHARVPARGTSLQLPSRLAETGRVACQLLGHFEIRWPPRRLDLHIRVPRLNHPTNDVVEGCVARCLTQLGIMEDLRENVNMHAHLRMHPSLLKRLDSNLHLDQLLAALRNVHFGLLLQSPSPGVLENLRGRQPVSGIDLQQALDELHGFLRDEAPHIRLKFVPEIAGQDVLYRVKGHFATQ